jgi:ectoine hydroxylase-related dioxygenase (phytanoyl-CoA dioxygenase family)
MKLSKSQFAAFDQNGVICLPQLIDRNWQQKLAKAVEKDISNPGPYYHGYKVEGGGNFHGNMRLWENDAVFRAYCFESPLPEIAGQLTESNQINLFYDQLFVKEPGTNAPTRWHNDQPYWPIRGWNVLSFWVSLDNITLESGALEFIKGSHKWGKWFQPEPFAEGGEQYESNQDYLPIPDIEAERDQHDILSWAMKPGDVLAFHGLILHGAPANSSQNIRRRGYTVRYCGDNVHYYDGIGTNKLLRNPKLKMGESLTSEQYPLVWKEGNL